MSWERELTLDAPVLVRVSEQHDQLVHCERQQISDGEHLREPVFERFGLDLGSMADDGVDDFLNVFLDVVLRDGDVLTARLYGDGNGLVSIAKRG